MSCFRPNSVALICFSGSDITYCESSIDPDEDLFHFDVVTGEVYSNIDSLVVKSGHVFNTDEMKLVVNPIVCYSG